MVESVWIVLMNQIHQTENMYFYVYSIVCLSCILYILSSCVHNIIMSAALPSIHLL